MTTDPAKPGPIALDLSPDYEDEVGLGGFHIESCELDGIAAGQEIVAPFERIEIVFKYPLARGFRFRFEQAGGFSRRRFVELVCRTYRGIYDVEEGRRSTVEGLVDAPDNAPPFGAFGHDIADLVLEGIVHEGEGKYRLHVGS